MILAPDVQLRFESLYHSQPSVYSAPGRVNLIGEHTDYNEGFVFPSPIGFFCYAAVAARGDREIHVYSENTRSCVRASLDELHPRLTDSWADYPLGVAWSLQEAGFPVCGVNLYIRGDVPVGAGLSSSAAVEVATARALLGAAGLSIASKELALLCQKAENEFVGARCGIMDQFVACHEALGRALLLDCRSLEFRSYKLPGDVSLVICNSMVQHSIGGGEYNKRRAECEQGVQILGRTSPGIRTLRDAQLADIETHREELGDVIYRRCRHVVTENDRVQRAGQALAAGALDEFGKLMAESHRSLRDDYEVSIRELDVLVQLATELPGVLGARMTGGGFGGCIVILADTQYCDSVSARMSAGYEEATGRQAEIYWSNGYRWHQGEQT